eukprot:1116259-Prorocentrum_minimum.AAC.2
MPTWVNRRTVSDDKEPVVIIQYSLTATSGIAQVRRYSPDLSLSGEHLGAGLAGGVGRGGEPGHPIGRLPRPAHRDVAHAAGGGAPRAHAR